MDVKLINPFVDAVLSVFPQIGFQSITKGSMAVKECTVMSKGVIVLVGLTDAVRGNIVYNMTEDSVKSIASVMMMGMPVPELDAMAQSAISELANMVTGNAASNFDKMGLVVDISPPNLVIGAGAKIVVSNTKFLSLELLANGIPFEVNLGLE